MPMGCSRFCASGGLSFPKIPSTPLIHNRRQMLIRPFVRFGSFATDPFGAGIEQCPLCAEGDRSRHECELTLSAISCRLLAHLVGEKGQLVPNFEAER